MIQIYIEPSRQDNVCLTCDLFRLFRTHLRLSSKELRSNLSVQPELQSFLRPTPSHSDQQSYIEPQIKEKRKSDEWQCFLINQRRRHEVDCEGIDKKNERKSGKHTKLLEQEYQHLSDPRLQPDE
jgi:hypothetical protein